MILTDAQGRPYERPTPPRPGAPIEDVIAYLRASSAYNDRVAAAASSAFADGFRKALREPECRACQVARRHAGPGQVVPPCPHQRPPR